MPRLAKMRTRVFIKKPDDVKDEYGGRTPKLVTYAERWAQVEVLGGRAAYYAQVLQSSVSHRVTLKFDPDIRAAWFVELQDTGEAEPPQLRIESVENTDMAKVNTVLICSTYKDRSGGK